MSLRDQLLKTGLVSEEKAKKVEGEIRKKTHKTKKNKALGAAEAAQRAQEQRKRQEREAVKREHDRQLNQEREAQKKQREAEARVRQIIDSNRIDEPGADVPFYFKADGRCIRRVQVTPQQQKLLANGRIGIVHDHNENNIIGYWLVPRDTALKLAELAPERLVLLYSQGDDDARDEAKT